MNIATTHCETDSFGFPIAGEADEIDASGIVEVSLKLLHHYGVTMPQVVENAGRALATLGCKRYFQGDAEGRSVVVLAGEGNIGASVMTAARRMANWGAKVRLVSALSQRGALGLASRQISVLASLGIVAQEPPQTAPDLIIDGLAGFAPDKLLIGHTRNLIDWANAMGAPVLSYEAPAGLFARLPKGDCTTIRADATLMVGIPKAGLAQPSLAATCGALYLADISIPSELWQSLSRPLRAASFARGDILRVLRHGEAA